MHWLNRVVPFVIVLGALLPSGRSWASTGGPELAELLGWDDRESRIFFRIVSFAETGDRPEIYYFDLATPGPTRLERVSWSARGRQDSLYEARIESLQNQLRPLEERLVPTIAQERTILEVDTLRNVFGSWPRYRVRLKDLQFLGEAVLEVMTIGDPCVSVIRQWAIPGRREHVAVVSFRGLPFEFGYEVQVPVLLPSDGGDVVIVERYKTNP